MMEISVILFTLLSEGFVALLVILVLWTLLAFKKKKKDRDAARQLIEQVKHQSQTRLDETGSFLSEKYQFEGNELRKAVEAIDKSEKRFIQKFVNIYLKRDADKLTGMDAALAEMIDTYKSLTPTVPDASSYQERAKEQQAEIARLKDANRKLAEEIAITKETMSNMIGEFGNMFGGGSEHELAKHEVIDKVQSQQEIDDEEAAKAAASDTPEVEADEAAETTEAEVVSDDNDMEDVVAADDDIDIEQAADDAVEAGAEPEAEGDEVAEEDIDDILDGIDLSDSKS